MKTLRHYRGFTVRTDARLTSQNPGEGHSLAQAEVLAQGSWKTEPNFYADQVVDRIAFELKCSKERASALFRDLTIFLWLCGQSADPRVPSPAIDEAWHVFLLFTKEYQAFCLEYCGGFIHHQPHHDRSAQLSVEVVAPTVDHVIAVFRGKPNENWDYVPFSEWLQAA